METELRTLDTEAARPGVGKPARILLTVLALVSGVNTKMETR
jgi:hypothetical protein